MVFAEGCCVGDSEGVDAWGEVSDVGAVGAV